MEEDDQDDFYSENNDDSLDNNIDDNYKYAMTVWGIWTKKNDCENRTALMYMTQKRMKQN